MLTFLVTGICSVSFLLAQNLPSSQGPPTELPKIAHFSPDVADSTLDPCTDFYKYSCQKWHDAHPIPLDEVAWGTAGPLNLWNQVVLGQTLEKLSVDNGVRTSNERKIGDFYFSCMDERNIEANSRHWLQKELDLVAGIKSRSDIAAEVAHLHQTIPLAWAQKDNQTPAVLFGFAGSPDFDDASRNVAQFDQGGMTLPSRSYYLDQDDKSKAIRTKYLLHIGNVLVLAGESRSLAESDAKTVLAMETELAKSAMDAITRRDPKNLNNRMSLAQVKQLSPSFDFDRYLQTVKAPVSPLYIVTSTEYFKGFEQMLRRRPLEDWKTYLRWRVIAGSVPALSDKFFEESFDFFGRTLAGAKEVQARWRRCVDSADFLLGEALGQAYVTRAFPKENKERVLRLVQDLNTALAEDIDSRDWMS